ncbi:unnamed protein product [Soboliphyme baturini]|uniref:Transmembrane protein n=1 Tax=Soboliphyme baturini TaxID=241478 RepID=A0A183IB09_9BILA|nr:unnamed protein product [Soboliphyme baturini]
MSQLRNEGTVNIDFPQFLPAPCPHRNEKLAVFCRGAQHFYGSIVDEVVHSRLTVTSFRATGPGLFYVFAFVSVVVLVKGWMDGRGDVLQWTTDWFRT